jgi:hypothetical protein
MGEARIKQQKRIPELEKAIATANFETGFLRLENERLQQLVSRLERDVENLTAQLEQEIVRSRNREPQFDNVDCGTF